MVGDEVYLVVNLVNQPCRPRHPCFQRCNHICDASRCNDIASNSPQNFDTRRSLIHPGTNHSGINGVQDDIFNFSDAGDGELILQRLVM